MSSKDRRSKTQPPEIKLLDFLYGEWGVICYASLSTAIEMYRAMEMIFWLPETEAALAQVEGH